LQLFDQGGIPFFRFDTFPEGLRHGVFTRQGGVSPAPFHSLNLSVSVPDDKANVVTNRARAYGAFGRATDRLVQAHLVHGATVLPVTADHYGHYVGPADAIITGQAGCGLAMNFADCAPILLYDPQRAAIGLGHAGWQGAVKDLPGAMVRAMSEAFGSRPADLIAAVGPCIGPCCYEVGEPVISAVQGAFANEASLLPLANGRPRPHFDLPGANRRCLERAGVAQVELSGLCTACRIDLFFSHRAENGRTGRFGAIFILD
jgi:YfiH family protein